MRIKFLVAAVLFFVFQDSIAQVRLPAIVRDSMILQRDAKLKIWGWASKGEKIRIRFNGKTVKAVANDAGNWNAIFPEMKAGGPYTMEITGKNKIVLKDILLGDVWFCSGQSNMVHQMALHNVTYEKDIDQANYPAIRHFWIPTTASMTGPKDDLPMGHWKWANPQDVNQFSAVAYFFARKIYEQYKVPIGLINASVGGTPIEAWTSEDGLKDFSAILSTVKKNKDTVYVNNINRMALANRPMRKEDDTGISGDLKWYDPSYIPKGWQRINIPGYWEDQGIKDLNGIVWYRREIEIPASVAGKAAKVFLGRIVDADVLYINGKQVGTTSYQFPQRRYRFPAGILQPGKNLFVIKVVNNAGKGGFVPDKPYYLVAGSDTIDLKGYWQYKVAAAFPPLAPDSPKAINAQVSATALYNAMVAPVTNYAIKGILWYQGESNADDPIEYRKLLPALIADWRAKWKQSDLPFLYVQLPNCMSAQYLPSESNWAVLREAALKTLSVPNTAMAVTIDLGEWNDVHPDNKKDVGERLALNALKLTYGEKDIVASGPLYQSSEIEGNKIVISFTEIGSGLISIDAEELKQFAIAGADKNFVWAKAEIRDNKVIVWSDEISSPLYVRYGWADNPVGINLYNKEGLPASPFRTDE